MGCSQSSSGKKAEKGAKIEIVKTNDKFDELLQNAGDKLVVVDFFATWCPPCKKIAPEFAKLPNEFGEIAVFYKVDVDKNKDTTQKSGVECYPTFLFFKNSQQVHKIEGADLQGIKDGIKAHGGKSS